MSIGGIGITTCALCGKKFTQTLGVVLRGTPDLKNHSAHVERQVQQLNDHLKAEHPQHYEAIDVYAAQYRGFLVLSNFRSTDEQIKKARDQMRWYLHAQTGNASIPDRNLIPRTRELSDEIALKLYNACTDNSTTAQIAAIVFGSLCPILQGFRDELQEPAKYKPLIGESREISVLNDTSEADKDVN
jgi:hypothetical protein